MFIADVVGGEMVSKDAPATYAYYFSNIKPKPASKQEEKKGSEAHSSLICCTGESHSSTRIVFSQRRPSVLALTCTRQQQGKDIGQTQPARALYEPRFFRIADIAISAASPPT